MICADYIMLFLLSAVMNLINIYIAVTLTRNEK